MTKVAENNYLTKQLFERKKNNENQGFPKESKCFKQIIVKTNV